MKETLREVCALVRAGGGTAFAVGGAVRDSILGMEPKDVDLEVFGLAPEKLRTILAKRFRLDEVGASFGVLKLHGLDIDVAIPRRETKLGEGHRAFGFDFDPSLTLAEAASRRDFTINAIYSDPLSGETLDPWGGVKDLENRVLRHVSAHFAEDPLRVLRGMQFVARFDLTPAPETLAICRTMTPENLPPERLFEEWRKLIVKGRRISRGLNFLKDVGWLEYYPELAALVGCEQAKEWHPEGDVWNHTLCSLDAFASQCAGKDEDERLIIGLAVLCHDFGKPATSFFDKAKGRIRSLGHDEAGLAPTLSFLKRLTNEERILKEVPPLVRLHMRPYAMWKGKSGENAIRRLASEVKRIDRLVAVCSADDAGRPPFPSEPEPLQWLLAEAERLAIKDSIPKPILLGRHLLANGFKPGEKLGRTLKAVYEAQLDGQIKDLDSAIALASRLHSQPPPVLIWDWNGTLLDDTSAAFETLNIMLAERGAKPITMRFYLDNFSFPVRPFYEKIGMVLENEDWDALAQEYHDIYFTRPKRLNQQAKAALAKAAKAGASQIVLSALRQDYLERETAAYGVGEFMDALYGVDNLDGASKLARGKAMMTEIRQKYGPEPRFVMIGDALHDKEVADELGIACVLCGTGSHAAWRLREVADTADGLIEAVEKALLPA